MDAVPSADDHTFWFFTLYGATMLSVQFLENSVSLLYVVARTDPQKNSGANIDRQLKVAMDRTWRAFQKGSAGMKLNDAKVGIKEHLAPDLYAELDAFISGPRNQLAHRYLVERVADIENKGRVHLFAAAGELLEIQQRATRLQEQLFSRAAEIMESWPHVPGPPEGVQRWIDDIARLVMLKQVPPDVLERARKARAKQNASRTED